MIKMKNKKPSIKHKHKKTKLLKKPAVSLTDEQYAEIFFAAIHHSQETETFKLSKTTVSQDKEKSAPIERTVAKSKPVVSLTNKPNTDIVIVASQETLKSQSPIPADSPGNKARTPSEIGDFKANPTEYSDPSSISTFNSEDFKRNAVFSTPTLSANNSVMLSQPPRSLSKRERLLWLQERRCNGMYVICDNAGCGKWRWLDNPDPVDLPTKWFCDMNPDAALASCSVAETPIPNRVEDDLVQNCYTTGSIVWAKLSGYPWWPAMVDDCPDCEQYYWVTDDTASGIPNWYHVVFFDNSQVTRRWILVKNLKSFKHNPDFDKKFKIKQVFKKRLDMAKQEATVAISLHIRDRLKKYSFLALWDQEIPEYLTSDEDLDGDESYIDYEKRIKKKIIQRKKAALKNKYQGVRSKNETCITYTNGNQQRENKKSVPSNKDLKVSNSEHTSKILTDKTFTKRNNLTESKVDHFIKDKIVSENKSIPQEKCKGKENMKDTSKQIFESKPPNNCIAKSIDTGLDNSNNLESRPVDHLLKGSNYTCDKDLAQHIYDGFLNMYKSGKHGEQEIEKVYKEMCSKNNSSESSPKSDINKDSVKCISNSVKDENKDKKNENGESTLKNKSLETSHKEDLHIKKRKKEEKPFSGDITIEKKVKKSFIVPVKKS